MRVTDSMMTNRMMLNINKNMTNIDRLYTQYATQKKINRPSDNPILTARALKFRTNVSDTEQYQRNVSQGLSWMDVSEAAFDNAYNQLDEIRSLCVGGSSDVPLGAKERQELTAKIMQLVEQIGAEMNITYSGRYVFSGFRTDQPPVFTESNDLIYKITQNFSNKDVEKIKSYRKLGDTDEPEVYDDVSIMKLAYKDMDTVNIAVVSPGPPALPVNVTPVSLNSTTGNPYQPGDNDINYIPETGELVLGKNVVAALDSDGLQVTYIKDGFQKGELNPQVYFTCQEASRNSAYPADSTAPKYLVNGKQYNMDDQSIEYIVGANVTIRINSLSKDVLTDKMYSDLVAFCDLVNSISFSDENLLLEKYRTENPGFSEEQLKEAVKKQQDLEEQQARAVLQTRFSDMLYLLDRHMTQISTEQTNLGSRMNRMELIQERLEEDYESYTKLLSDTEDADILEVLMNLQIAESVFNASLKAGASVIQTSLADYIR